MNKIQLFPHQKKALQMTAGLDHVAYYMEMGLGKTFVGSEKMMELGCNRNIIVCQKSKIKDWTEHIQKYYPSAKVINFPKEEKKLSKDGYFVLSISNMVVVVVNYELLWRRTNLQKFGYGCTLMLDESSLIQNHKAKQTKCILSLNPENVILLSGTPCSGKYENLWSQSRLLKFGLSKSEFDRRYVNWQLLNFGAGFVRVPDRLKPYKNVEDLKEEFREHGAVFMKTEECFELPMQTFQNISVPMNKEYKSFRRNKIIVLDEKELVGDTTLAMRIGLREICGIWSKEKLAAFNDILDSTNERLIVFYNFNAELKKLVAIAQQHERKISQVNGSVKDLSAYEENEYSITFCQYQAGSMGLNLQKANKVIYYTLPERSDLFEQSKKRIHRIGQEKPCWYYIMLVEGSVEEAILQALERKEDFTDELFRKYEEGGENVSGRKKLTKKR